MRVFKNDSIWDKEEQQWIEMYSVDDINMTENEYLEEISVEELATEEEELCQCCMCEDKCNDYECTCECNELKEEFLEEPCQCVDCKSAREEFTEDEENDIALVEHYADIIENIYCNCGCELRNALYDLICTAKEIGFEDSREEILDFLD